jgi:biopolymer transport protein ExbD
MTRLPRIQAAGGVHLLMAPSLGVLLCLGFFLVLGGYFTLQPGIELKVPESPFLLLPQHDPRVVSVTGAPLPQIYFDQRVVTTEELTEALHKGRRAGSLIIRADRLAPYDLLMKIMTIGAENGYTVVLAGGAGGQ